SDLRPAVLFNFLEFDSPSNCVSKFYFFVTNRVTSQQRDACFSEFIEAATHNFPQNALIDPLRGESNKAESRLCLAAHRVNVAQRVGRRDLTERVRIIHNGREEIDRLHYCYISCELKDAGVVRVFVTDQNPREGLARYHFQGEV